MFPYHRLLKTNAGYEPLNVASKDIRTLITDQDGIQPL